MHNIKKLLAVLLFLMPGAAFSDDGDPHSPALIGERWSAIGKSQVREKVAEIADPHGGASTWLAPAPDIQVSADTSLPSLSRGGIFVPAMTEGMHEPKFQVTDDHNNTAEGYTGSVVYVPPGDYTVSVGSLSGGNPLEFDVHVVEGSVTTVPVEWSGLLVRVVNARGSMIRGEYEIVSLPERAYIGLGSGALVNEGEHDSTWLLWPGKYMIISVGEGYQARKNFLTVVLKPGELSRMTLVLDEDTGDILGGGEIEEPEEINEKKWWNASLLVGGSVKFNSSQDVIGKATGQLFDLSAFVESYFSMLLKKNFLYIHFNAEIGGSIHIDDRPFVTTVDALNLELLYAYRVVDWFGPYIRFSFDSNMAPSVQEFSSPYNIYIHSGDEEILKESEALDFQLSPSFSPILLKAGAGARFDAIAGTWFKLNARLGLAYRHVVARDLYVIDSINNNDSKIIINSIDSHSKFGAEAALNFDLTPVRWFTLKVDSSILEPFTDATHPVVDLNLDAAFRISSIASLSYSLRLTYDTQMIDKVQLDQYVQLRFSYKVF